MGKQLSQFDLRSIYKRWRRDAGPFRCFFRSANFVSLQHYPNFLVNEISDDEDDFYRQIEGLVAKYNPKTTLFIIDTDVVPGLKTAYLLQKFKKIKTILTFNSPLHPLGLVGGGEYISSLLGYGECLEAVEPVSYAFLLDQNRYGDYTSEELHQFFNNQYELTDDDLPDAEMLKFLGYEAILYINSGQIKEDIAGYLEYLREQGLKCTKHSLQGV